MQEDPKQNNKELQLSFGFFAVVGCEDTLTESSTSISQICELRGFDCTRNNVQVSGREMHDTHVFEQALLETDDCV